MENRLLERDHEKGHVMEKKWKMLLKEKLGFCLEKEVLRKMLLWKSEFFCLKRDCLKRGFLVKFWIWNQMDDVI